MSPKGDSYVRRSMASEDGEEDEYFSFSDEEDDDEELDESSTVKKVRAPPAAHVFEFSPHVPSTDLCRFRANFICSSFSLLVAYRRWLISATNFRRIMMFATNLCTCTQRPDLRSQ